MEQISNKIMGTDGVIFSLAHKNKGGYTQSFLNLLWKNKVVEIEALATPRKKKESVDMSLSKHKNKNRQNNKNFTACLYCPSTF